MSVNQDSDLARIREASMRISERFHHDPELLVNHYMELQQRHQDRLVFGSQGGAFAKFEYKGALVSVMGHPIFARSDRGEWEGIQYYAAFTVGEPYSVSETVDDVTQEGKPHRRLFPSDNDAIEAAIAAAKVKIDSEIGKAS